MNSRLLRYCASLILTYKSCCELSKQETWVLVQIQQNSGPVRLKCEHHVDQTRLKDKVVARKSLNLIYSIKKIKINPGHRPALRHLPSPDQSWIQPQGATSQGTFVPVPSPNKWRGYWRFTETPRDTDCLLVELASGQRRAVPYPDLIIPPSLPCNHREVWV